MNLFIAALLGGLVQAAGTLVGRVLISLGVGFVVFTGVDASITAIKGQALASLNSATSFGPQIAAFIGVLQVGTCINIVFSAWSARLVLAGLTGGTLKRMVLK